MKVSEYNQMMAYLTRPPTNEVAGLVDELEPGPLKDELQEKFDSDQETYEEYLRRTRLGERPFNAAEGGSPTVAEDTFTLEDFQKRADGLVQGSFGGMKKGIEGIKLLKDTMDELITKALDSGAIKSKKEAIDFILEREKYYMDLIESEKAKGVEVPVLSRDDFAIGGGAFVGRDLGTREGFNVLIPVSELPKDQQKYVKQWLKNNPDKKWEELSIRERADLKKGVDVGSGSGSQVKKGAENPQYKPLSKEGEKIAKKLYGTTNISRYKKDKINRGQITLDTKPVKFQKGKDISLKMKKNSEVVTGVEFPEETINPEGKIENAKELEKRFIKFIKNRVKFPQTGLSGSGFSNPDIAEEFPISAKQGGRLARYYINKLGLKYATKAKDTQSAISAKKINELYDKGGISSKKQEGRITSLKTPILKKENLVRLVDKAHRVSKTHMEKLGLKFDTNLIGMDSRIINQVVVKPSEVELRNLYARQLKTLDLLKENPGSETLQNKMIDLNKQIKQVVKNTSGRLIGVTIDPNTLEPSFEGMKKKYSLTKFLGQNYKIADLDQIPSDELSKAIAKAVNAEAKRGFVPNDFKNILSNKKSQKAMLEYAKKRAPDAISGLKKAFSNPTSKVSMKLMSTFPALFTAGAIGTVGYQALKPQPVMADDMSTPVDPGLPVTEKEEFDPERAEPGLAAAGTLYGGYKYGPQLLKLLKGVGKGAAKVVGSAPSALAFAGYETKAGMNEGKSFVDAVTEPMVGVSLLAPETVKTLGPLMARSARVFTPVGATITGIGTLKSRTQDMLREADRLTTTPYQEDLLEDYAAKQYKGYAAGGRVGFSIGGIASLFRNAARVSESLNKIKNSVFDMWNNVRMFGEQKGIAKNLTPYTNIPNKNRKISSLEDIEKIKTEVPEKYHEEIDSIKNSIEQNNFETAWKQYENFEKNLDPTLKFENIPEEYFPMVDPLNDAFVITGPRDSFKTGRYEMKTSMEIDPQTGKPTGKYQTEKYDTFDPETRTFREEPVLVGASTEKGKKGFN